MYNLFLNYLLVIIIVIQMPHALQGLQFVYK